MREDRFPKDPARRFSAPEVSEASLAGQKPARTNSTTSDVLHAGIPENRQPSSVELCDA